MTHRAALPLTLVQTRIEARLAQVPAPDSQSALAFRLRGPLDVPALRAALSAIVDRHEPLRTTFEPNDRGGMSARVSGRSDVVPALVDLSGRGDRREEVARRLLRRIARRPLDLAAGRSARALLVRLGPAEHVLLVAAHRLAADRGSHEPFVRELSALYAALHAGAAPALQDLAPSATEVAQREHAGRHDFTHVREAAFWREALRGARGHVALPELPPGDAGRGGPAARRVVLLGADRAERFLALCRSEGATISEALAAALFVLLFRYTGRTDLVLGMPRRTPALAPLIGCFDDVLVIRARLNAGGGFRETLRTVRGAIRLAGDHPALSLEALRLEESKQDAALPLNVLFSGTPSGRDELRLAPLRVAPYPLAAAAEADLHIGFRQTAHGLCVDAEYDTGRLSADAVDRLLHNFFELVTRICEAPETPIERVALLAAPQRTLMLDAWNPPAEREREACSIDARFARQAARTPEAVAIVDGTTSLTYGELDREANRLAHVLRARGVDRDELVAVAMDRSVWTVVSMLAILKARGAYLPLDAAYSPARLKRMLADSGARIVLTRRARDSRFEGIAEPARCVDVDAAGDALEAGDACTPPQDPGDLAYVMFTSGSTGRPKGVLITHGAIDNLVHATPLLAIGPRDVVAQLSNISFDGATYEIWGALLNGARLEIAERETMLAPAALAEWLRERCISVAFLTSSLLHAVSREAPAAFATLRCLITGGEVVDPGAIRAIFAHGAPRLVIDAYGPSEATTFATLYPIETPPHGPIPIGKPLGNVQTYILDSSGAPVPIGVEGELHIGGRGLARGYLNDPAATERAFKPHPFSSDSKARVYATGDIARYRADGNIEFIGRRDRQIKLRGFRIEMDAIEAALRELPQVADAAVTFEPDDSGECRLVAYVVDAERPTRDSARWRERLGDALPQPMLPTAFHTVEKLPLTENGKVDTEALRASAARAAAGAHRPRLAAANAAPTAADVEITCIFADVLGIAGCTIHDDFFMLGGHSLLAARVVARIADRFGIRLALRDFFSGPTAEKLARRLANAAPQALRPLRAAPDSGADQLSEAAIDALLAEAVLE